ncbi:hypothetical protein [Clostridium weizhouense]|uniref:Uncharacterized protein n=1 Tax=Clostridium weizhouense TaxID=2859781 RepID=A0ABS7ANH7_9CLOT|nr:hypothetical protein [Clostridium weizhouense]MBW6410208.1 hypothetical protein [Clostridium weizhouense]
MKRKKKGSSLITVVIIFSVLITVGTAMLSMTVGDYKMRVKESTQIKNLYSSESGLDSAYYIIIKTFDKAAEYGDFKVKQLKAGKCQWEPHQRLYEIAKEKRDNVLNNKNSTSSECKKAKRQFNNELEELSKLEFERSFKNFISKSQNNNQASYKEKIPENFLADSITNTSYNTMSFNNREIEKNIDDNEFERMTKLEFIKLSNDNKLEPELFVYSDEDLKKINELERKLKFDEQNNEIQDALNNLKKSVDGIKLDNNEFNITITSEFKSKNENAQINGENLRRLQTSYTIVVPEYKDISFSNSITNVVLDNKVLIVGENMKVKNSNLNVKGNIFVQGKDESTDDWKTRDYDKYKGGIKLNSDSKIKLNFNGDVVTGKTFNIVNNIDVMLEGNLYATNIYLGQENRDYSKESNLNVTKSKNNKETGKVFIDNDLTLKAKNSSVKIDKFYGLNDKNIKHDKEHSHDKDAIDGRTSSSIILNGEDNNSTIEINEEAYIMGVSRINTSTKDGYSTGESIGIKDNYQAYSIPLDDTEKFEYYDPLQLLKEDDVIKKSKHFKKYWDDPNRKESVKGAGRVTLPKRNTYTVGATVYTDNGKNIVGESNFNLSDMKISDKREDYASKVYRMGKGANIDVYNSLGKDAVTVESLMYLEDIDKVDNYKLANQSGNNEKAIFNKDPNKTIIIKEGNGANEGEIEEDEDNIYVYSKAGKVNAFIATAGDVTIEGKMDFDGSMMINKDLNIIGSEEKNILYDKEVINRIQSSNKEIFDEVFAPTLNGAEGNDRSSVDVQYDLNKFIKTGLWKIKK